MGTAHKMHDEIIFQEAKKFVDEAYEDLSSNEFFETVSCEGIDDLTPYLGEKVNLAYAHWMYLNLK